MQYQFHSRVLSILILHSSVTFIPRKIATTDDNLMWIITSLIMCILLTVYRMTSLWYAASLLLLLRRLLWRLAFHWQQSITDSEERDNFQFEVMTGDGTCNLRVLLFVCKAEEIILCSLSFLSTLISKSGAMIVLLKIRNFLLVVIAEVFRGVFWIRIVINHVGHK